MRRSVELFVNEQRVELFDFEDINIVDSIQDVRDISKVFVPYSKEFKIPASKINNKIFKHYHNNEIINGFDARFKISAYIKVGGEVYKRGRVTLLGSSMGKGRPDNYRVMFFSRTIDFKTLLKDDLLSNLGGDFLSQYNLTYDVQSSYSGFNYGYNLVGGVLDYTEIVDPNNPKDLIIPFISSNNYYFYDSIVPAVSPLEGDTESRNININESTEPNGIYWKDLRPSLRLPIIIDAIENKYNISFVSDFFSKPEFSKLYLWLNNDKGLYGDKRTITSDLGDMALESGDVELRPVISDPFNIPLGGGGSFDNIYHKAFIYIGAGGVNDKYGLTVRNKIDSSILLETTAIGDASFSINLYDYSVSKEYDLQIEISDTDSLNTDIDITIEKWRRYERTNFELLESSNYSETSLSTDNVFDVARNMPKIKVIDFLTGLFKMFNLTAYVDDDENIVIDTLDDYYTKGHNEGVKNITKHIDVDSYSVDRNRLYSQIDFIFEDPKTFATINSNEITQDEFGNERMQNVNEDVDLKRILAFDGGEYEVNPKFEKMQYERMTDQSDDSIEMEIAWGWCVTSDQNATLTAPILHYAENIDVDTIPSTVQIGWDSTTVQDTILVNYYYRPANSLSTKTTHYQSLNFGSENDEFQTHLGANEVSLFNTYWKNTIESIYDEKSRITTFKANIPVSTANRLKLNHTVAVNRKLYRINKIDINITTGDTTLELITYRKITPYVDFRVDSDEFTVDSTLITADKTL